MSTGSQTTHTHSLWKYRRNASINISPNVKLHDQRLLKADNFL